MPRDKMKLDYNNLIREIMDTLNTLGSEDPETVFLANIEGDTIPDYDQYKVAEWLDWEAEE